jgi:hypothetical protein
MSSKLNKELLHITQIKETETKSSKVKVLRKRLSFSDRKARGTNKALEDVSLMSIKKIGS